MQLTQGAGPAGTPGFMCKRPEMGEKAPTDRTELSNFSSIYILHMFSEAVLSEHPTDSHGVYWGN